MLQVVNRLFFSNFWKMNRSTLIVFDFDHTIIDDNSDTIARSLVPSSGLTSAEELYKSTKSWTLYMGEIFKCLHDMNVPKQKIISAIQLIPPIKEMDKFIKLLDCNQYEVIIISDSNSVFIDEWLNFNNLGKIVRKVITNPAWFDDSELLHIEFYEHQTFCDISEPNLCKGHAMENYVNERKSENMEFDRIVYIGDGKNDFCPVLKLCESDFVFPRMNYSLFRNIKDNEESVKAKIFPWIDGSDIIEVFKRELDAEFV